MPPWEQTFRTFHSWLEEDDALCFITVDLRAAEGIGRGHGVVVSAMYDLAEPDDRGMPRASERPAMNKLEDTFEAALTAFGEPWNIGTRIERGKRYLLFYLPDETINIELDNNWPGAYELRWFSEPDPEWSEYRESLEPTPFQRKLALAKDVQEELEKLGDQLELERPVDHWIGFPDQDRADDAAAALTADGFSNVSKSEDGLFVSATLVHAVDTSSLENALSRVFQLVVEPYAGEYDGWGAPTAVEPAKPRKGLFRRR